MSIFHEQMEVVNRAPWTLSVRFDGAEMNVPVNYEWFEGEAHPIPGVKNFIPRQVWGLALNQNPIMGTQDPYNPHVSGAQYLIGDPAKPEKYPCEALTPEQIKSQRNKPSRFDYEGLMSEKLGKHDRIEIRGRRISRAEIADSFLVGTDRQD